MTPLARGGTDDRENLVAACWPCNSEKFTFTPDEWRAWRLARGLSWPPESKSKSIIEILERVMPQFLADLRAERAEQDQTGEAS